MAVPIILALHVVILGSLALIPPRAPPEALIFIDLSPNPGEGLQSSIDGVPSVSNLEPKTETDQALDPAAPRTEEKPEPAEPSTDDPETPDTSQPGVDAPVTPRGIIESQAAASSPSADVLALVETMTGSKADALADTPPLTAPVPYDLMAQIRFDQARLRAAGGAGSCAIDASLKEDLSNDTTVQAVLRTLPSTDRSVSNAVQIWDGEWTSGVSAAASDPLAAIRDRVVAVVQAASPPCRNAVVRGPRFLIVPVQGGPEIVIVVGSGEWRWRDVLPPKKPSLLRWLGLNR